VLSTLQKQQHNFSLGEKGESQAVHYLKNKGYLILELNVRYRQAEVDIVALDKKQDEVVFVEVKTRTEAFYGHPSDAIDRRKLKKLQSVARSYCYLKKLRQDYRFDSISILPHSIDHYENISWEMVK
jgi:putative endonuclease